jgi:hypothetical protein
MLHNRYPLYELCGSSYTALPVLTNSSNNNDLPDILACFNSGASWEFVRYMILVNTTTEPWTAGAPLDLFGAYGTAEPLDDDNTITSNQRALWVNSDDNRMWLQSIPYPHEMYLLNPLDGDLIHIVENATSSQVWMEPMQTDIYYATNIAPPYLHQKRLGDKSILQSYCNHPTHMFDVFTQSMSTNTEDWDTWTVVNAKLLDKTLDGNRFLLAFAYTQPASPLSYHRALAVIDVHEETCVVMPSNLACLNVVGAETFEDLPSSTEASWTVDGTSFVGISTGCPILDSSNAAPAVFFHGWITSATNMITQTRSFQQSSISTYVTGITDVQVQHQNYRGRALIFSLDQRILLYDAKSSAVVPFTFMSLNHVPLSNPVDTEKVITTVFTNADGSLYYYMNGESELIEAFYDDTVPIATDYLPATSSLYMVDHWRDMILWSNGNVGDTMHCAIHMNGTRMWSNTWIANDQTFEACLCLGTENECTVVSGVKDHDLAGIHWRNATHVWTLEQPLAATPIDNESVLMCPDGWVYADPSAPCLTVEGPVLLPAGSLTNAPLAAPHTVDMDHGIIVWYDRVNLKSVVYLATFENPFVTAFQVRLDEFNYYDMVMHQIHILPSLTKAIPYHQQRIGLFANVSLDMTFTTNSGIFNGQFVDYRGYVRTDLTFFLGSPGDMLVERRHFMAAYGWLTFCVYGELAPFPDMFLPLWTPPGSYRKSTDSILSLSSLSSTCGASNMKQTSGRGFTDGCVACPPGTANCEVCPVNTYRATPGAPVACQTCPPSTCTRGLTGQATCVDCTDQLVILRVSPLQLNTDNQHQQLTMILTEESALMTVTSVLLNGEPCTNIERVNQTAIVCTYPSGYGRGVVTMTANGITTVFASEALTYAPAVIQSLEIMNGTTLARAGGDLVCVNVSDPGVGAELWILSQPSTPHASLPTCFWSPAGFGASVTPLFLQGGTSWVASNPQLLTLNYAPCGAGFIANDCLPCPPGTYQPNADTDVFACLPCPANTYCANNATTQPTPCEETIANSISEPSSTNSAACQCPDAMTRVDQKCVCSSGLLVDGSCVACPEGTIVDTSTYASCSACPTGSTSNQNHTLCVCKEGWMWSAASSACELCPPGFICYGETYDVMEGYYAVSASKTQPCLYADACVAEGCAVGYEGPLCAVCSPGYEAATPYQACKPCYRNTQSSANIAVLSLLAVTGTLLAVTALHAPLRAKWAAMIAWLYKPAIRTKTKVLVTQFQIISQFQRILSVNYPDTYTAFLQVCQIASLNVPSMLSASCASDGAWTFYDDLLLHTLTPFAVCLLILVAYRFKWRDEACAEWLLWTMYFFFPGASSTVLEAFHCDESMGFLRADYRLTCDTSDARRAWYLVYATVMALVYPLGVPCLLLGCLWRYRRSRSQRASLAVASRRSVKLESDLASVRQVVEGLQKTENRLAAAFMLREVEGRYDVECWRGSARPVAFLFEAYHPRWWWWEMVECARRLLLSGLLVFMYPGSPKQVAMGIFLCTGFMALFGVVSPFLTRDHNMIMQISLFGILLQLVGTLLWETEVMGASVGGWMVGVGVVTPVATLAWTRSMFDWPKYRRRGVEMVRSCWSLVGGAQEACVETENPVKGVCEGERCDKGGQEVELVM